MPGGLSCLPALGVSDCRVLGTDFSDYAIVFTQLEFKDEAFSTGSYTVSGGDPGPAHKLPAGHSHAVREAHRPRVRGQREGPAAWAGPCAPRDPVPRHGPLCLGPHPCTPPAARGAAGAGGTGVKVPSCPTGRTELASQEAVCLFTRWSRGLGFLSQQPATLQRDCECPPGPPPTPKGPPGPPPCPRTRSLPLVSGSLPASVSQARLGRVSSSRSHLLPARSQADRGGPVSGEAVGPTSRLPLSPQSPVRTRPSR